ncbi:hypothetical protein DPEC_G00362080 [Dallia pectoralis]|nr:hypothetical protein DPEC_G00362080 [Dallia pectoralis]
MTSPPEISLRDIKSIQEAGLTVAAPKQEAAGRKEGSRRHSQEAIYFKDNSMEFVSNMLPECGNTDKTAVSLIWLASVKCDYGLGTPTAATVHLDYGPAQIQTCPLLPREVP